MAGRWIRRGIVALVALVGVVAVVLGCWVAAVALATRTAVASVEGTRTGMPVDGPVTIARDERGVPHVRAGSVHDLFVAEGYAMASDRLFQMDATRRYVDGQLAELLGAPVVRVDRRMRRFGIRALAARVYAQSSPDERALLEAFATGVNAAAAREPVPPEYVALLAGFEPWKPEDSLAVGFATVLDLDDRPDDVVIRDRVLRLLGRDAAEALYPLTDPKYDMPTNGRPPGPIPTLPPLPPPRNVILSLSKDETDERAPIGSNGWVVGAERSASGRAMLANDPHLSVGIPAIWYLFEGSAPGIHIAGAALAGTPGVTLGHNEHLVWGVTAGETAAMRVIAELAQGDQVYEHGRWVALRHRHERIGVRFGRAVDLELRESDRGVVIERTDDGRSAYVMDWRMQHHPTSPLAPFTRLLRARTTAEGVGAMRALPEPALNVLFADDGGRVAYHFAGGVPMEPSWGRWASDEGDPEPASLPYDRAPHVDPSRSAVIVTSNNRSDGAGSPRLAPFWPPPYRAYEIDRTLNASLKRNGTLTLDDLASAQRDARSPAELEFATLILQTARTKQAARDFADLRPVLDALAQFDGQMLSDSRGAAAVVELRREMLSALANRHLPPQLAFRYPPTSPGFEIVLRALRERPRGWIERDDYDGFIIGSLREASAHFNGTVPAFGDYAAQPLAHALAPFGLTAWNGPTLPGRGGSFAPAVQWNGHAQSFRAIWTAGDWDNGTIDIDAGESGEPGSPHYHDQSAGWVRFERTRLPFSDAAVRAATRTTLILSR